MLVFDMEAYMQKRFTEEQIIAILREAEVDGAVIHEFCRKHIITEQTFFVAAISRGI
jgi:putative transposase